MLMWLIWLVILWFKGLGSHCWNEISSSGLCTGIPNALSSVISLLIPSSNSWHCVNVILLVNISLLIFFFNSLHICSLSISQWNTSPSLTSTCIRKTLSIGTLLRKPPGTNSHPTNWMVNKMNSFEKSIKQKNKWISLEKENMKKRDQDLVMGL